MSIYEIKTRIGNIEKRIASIKKSRAFGLQQLRKLEDELHLLHIWENQAEEFSAEIY